MSRRVMSKVFGRSAGRAALQVCRRSVLTWLLLAIGAMGTTSHAQAQPKPTRALVASLQKGGYVLFIRHLDTNPEQADTDPLHLENEAAQRQLSEQGRARAKALGEALRALGIPVERVLTSQFKRARDTAQLLALAESEASVDLTEGGLVVSPRENQRRAAALRALLARAPAAGKNLVIVSHRPNLQEAAGKDLGDLGEGEVAVFRAAGTGQSKLVARVPVDTWLQWAAGAASARKAPAKERARAE